MYEGREYIEDRRREEKFLEDKKKGLNKPKASLNDRPVRILTFDITADDEGMTVREYLNKKVKFSNHQISSLKFRADGILVNSLTRRVTTVLKDGDELKIGLKDSGNEYLESGNFDSKLRVLFENEDMLLIDKEAGMVCHPSPGHYSDTAANQVAAYARDKGENWMIRPIGRLDADTTGILLFAKNSETAALLTKQRNEGKMKKLYLALCEGIIKEDRGMIDTPIMRDEDNLGKMKLDERGKEAFTYYKVLKRTSDKTLVELRIEHGRTHQIRIHMASIGHPLVGDPFYGNGIKNQTFSQLHAYKLSLYDPYSNKEINIEAPIPEKMLEQIEM